MLEEAERDIVRAKKRLLRLVEGFGTAAVSRDYWKTPDGDELTPSAGYQRVSRSARRPLTWTASRLPA